MVTLSSSAMTIIIGTILGFAVGLVLTYGFLPLRLLARLYVDVMRGIPVLVLILFTYYGLAIFKLGVKPYWAGVIALSLFCVVACRGERARRRAVDPAGPDEAGKAIGMRFGQWLRYIILPQAVRRVLPPWVNTALEIVKGTTLLSVIGVVELLLANQQAIARNYMILQFYMAATIIYIIINFLDRPGRGGAGAALRLSALLIPPDGATDGPAERPRHPQEVRRDRGAQGHRPRHRPERGGGADRRLRLGQDDVSALHQPARGVSPGPRSSSTASRSATP